MKIAVPLFAVLFVPALLAGCVERHTVHEDWRNMNYVSVDCPPTATPSEGCRPEAEDSLAAIGRRGRSRGR